MVTSEEEITRRLSEKDTARSARRAEAATMVGELARRHAALAAQVAELERELGEVLTAAGDVIDVSELAQVTDIPAADLTRWRDSSSRGKRRRSTTTKARSGATNGHPTTIPRPTPKQSAESAVAAAST
ncbi:hypothetical protein [Amycolatopsis tucumanensis]|uniref:Transposase n=1 Tax=Amycolatopsis tucumanensis TaxID=401106 RepID=A0ABP7JPS3_9PSEU|nr:hypothetical protein [Amycolatopsis tucumanensis]MCF6424980.1 hypothetical protein [Amycolatopsis tucumanensis]